MCSSPRQRATQHDASIIKEEPKSDIPGMTPDETSEIKMNNNSKLKCTNSSYYDKQFHEEKKDTRVISPLDTIAEVACRLGTALPLIAERTSNSLPTNAYGAASQPSCQERGNDSPTSIPTQETTSTFPPITTELGAEVGHEVSITLHSLLGILRRCNMGTVSNASNLGNKPNQNGRAHGANSKKIVDQVCEEIGALKDVVVTTLGTIIQEINKVKAEVGSLQKAIESIQRERGGGQSGEMRDMRTGAKVDREDVVTVKPEDVGKVWLIVPPVENREDDKDMKKEEDARVDGNVVRMCVEGQCSGKREKRSNDWTSSGSEVDARGGKKMRKMMTRVELRETVEGGESVTRTESTCNSGKSDWDYTENGCKRMRRDGVVGKVKGKAVKRRRDNWTDEENKVFMGMVLGSQEVEEMTLRRMLARRFSPRRTHEQCANHLRILRAQKKLPPAREDGAVLAKDKSCATRE